MHDLIEKYSWVTADEYMAWTIAVVTGRTPDEVVRAYGGDPTRPAGEYTYAQAFALQGERLDVHVQILTTGAHVVAIENNGWSGSVAEIARRTSTDGGRFFSVYWSASGARMIAEAVNGAMTACLEVQLGPLHAAADELAPPWLRDLDLDVEHVKATCMALMERQTGVEFERGWLDERLPTYRIPDPHWLTRDVPGATRP